MIHIGILGGGNISETHARAAHETEGVTVAAIYGHNREKANRLSNLYGGTAYADLELFLNHKPLDAVLIGSPSGLHAKHGVAAAKRNLHVLVEKPIDVTTEAADRLIAACEKSNVKLGVMFQDRVAADIVRLKKVVDSGHLGKPLLVAARVRWYRPPEYYGASKWRGTWTLDGGGALMNQAVHTVDLVQWLLGPVVRVYGKAVTALHTIEVEDTVVATLEFANGCIGTLEAATSAYPGYRRRVELTGTEGTIMLEHDRIIAVDLRHPTEEMATEVAIENQNASANSPIVSDVRGHQKLLEDFVRAVQTNSQPVCDGPEGRRSVEIVQAIYRSSESRQAVEM